MENDVLDQPRAQLGAARRDVLTREPLRGVGTAGPTPAGADPAEPFAKLAGKALDNLADKLGAALRSGGGSEQLEDALRDALVATAKGQAKTLVEAAPFGKTLLVAFDVSVAFADGVGEELEKANERLVKEYDALIRSAGGEIGPDELAAMQRLRGWQARSTRELNGIVEAGLKRAAGKYIAKKLDGKLKGFYEKLVGGLAKHFVASNEVFAALNGAVVSAAGAIPPQRRAVERAFFSFAVRLWIKQLADERLAKDLEPLLRDHGAGRSPDVALLASLLDIVARGTYASATQGTLLEDSSLARIRAEIEWEAWEAARRLAQRIGIGTQVNVSADGQTHLDGPAIRVPRAVYDRLERGGQDPSDGLRRWETALLVHRELEQGLRAHLQLVGRAHQRAIDRTPAERRYDEWERRSALLARERAHADDQARRALAKLLAQFEDVVSPSDLVQAGSLDSGPLIHLPIVTRRLPYGGLSPRPENDR